MTVSHYTLDLLIVLVLLLQFVRIGQLFFFSGQQWLDLIGGVALPDAQVGVLGARDEVLGVVSVEDRVDLLHALRVVYFARAAIVVGEDANSLVEACSSELFAGWREVDVENG